MHLGERRSSAKDAGKKSVPVKSGVEDEARIGLMKQELFSPVAQLSFCSLGLYI